MGYVNRSRKTLINNRFSVDGHGRGSHGETGQLGHAGRCAAPAFDSVGRARTVTAFIKALAEGMAAGIDRAAAFKIVDWKE